MGIALLVLPQVWLLFLVATTLHAQGSGGVAIGGGGGGTARNAINYNSNVLELRSKDNATFAPTVYGVLMAPEQQPVLPSQHRASWTWCEQSGSVLTCEDKINYNGTVVSKARVQWQLP